MAEPSPQELIDRLRAHPRCARLLDALAGVRGAHLVGGAVRDLLRGGDPYDLDVVVEGDAESAAHTAAERLNGRVVAHERFGTATVSAEGLAFDVATARSERYAAPGALPDVAPASLEEDLRRRDFTVNALAIALDGPRPGALTALPGALEDLEARRLRVLHDPSFQDDPTRLLRLLRYAARLRFEIEPHTRKLAEQAIEGATLGTVSGARIAAELMAMVREPTALAALELASRLGLDRELHPRFELDGPLAEAGLALLPADGRPELLLLAACCRAFSLDELRSWLDALELPAAERDTVIAAALGAPTLADELRAAGKPSQIAAAGRDRPLEQVALAGGLGPHDTAHRWLADLRHVQLEIDGEDLKAAGVPEGPEIGRALAAALVAKLDGSLAGRDAELAAALAALGRK